MQERQQLTVAEVARWLDTNYFAHKIPPSQNPPNSPSQIYAESLLGVKQRRWEKYEGGLSGGIAEHLFKHVLTFLSPDGYSVEMTNLELDSLGCDILIRKDREIIGGIDLKSGKSSYKNSHDSRITDFPVITLLMEHLGVEEVFSSIRRGHLPDLETTMYERMTSKNGIEMLKQLQRKTEDKRISLPKGEFSKYLCRIAMRAHQVQQDAHEGI